MTCKYDLLLIKNAYFEIGFFIEPFGNNLINLFIIILDKFNELFYCCIRMTKNKMKKRKRKYKKKVG